MLKKVVCGIGIAVFLFSFSIIVNATPIDLSSWSEEQYDFSGYQPPGTWVLSNNNETVTQTVNADPSMYLNGVSQTSYQMDGTWQVVTGSDDDFMGFVFGYQDASHFYMMDWKQTYQNEGGYGIGQEGFSIKKISADSKGDLSAGDFWESSGTANTTVLASNFGTTEGWADNTLYNFHLDFQPGTFTVVVKQGDTELWNVTVDDNSFTWGQFGFYNFSQSMVEYNGFEQTGGEPVPEPGTLFLLAIGITGIGMWRKFRR
jgi:hypothetical protein